jgi:putative oxidoreductase
MLDDSREPSALVFFLARFLFSLLFIVSGIGKIDGYEGTVELAAVSGVPAPHIAVALAAIIEIGLPVLLLLGWKTRWAAIGLIVLVLATNGFFHRYWEMEGEGRILNKIMLFKNFAIIGGLMLLAMVGPGRWSLERSETVSRP